MLHSAVMKGSQPIALVSLMHGDHGEGHHRWPPGSFGAVGGTLLENSRRSPSAAALIYENGQQVTPGTVHEVPASAVHDNARTVTRFPRRSMQDWRGERPL
jgi:hypothetical protein